MRLEPHGRTRVVTPEPPSPLRQAQFAFAARWSAGERPTLQQMLEEFELTGEAAGDFTAFFIAHQEREAAVSRRSRDGRPPPVRRGVPRHRGERDWDELNRQGLERRSNQKG